MSLNDVLDGIASLFPEQIPASLKCRTTGEVIKVLDNAISQKVNKYNANELTTLLTGLIATCQLRSMSLPTVSVTKSNSLYSSINDKIEYRYNINKHLMSNHKNIALQMDKLAQIGIFADVDLLIYLQLIMVSRFSDSSLKAVKNIFASVLKLYAVNVSSIFNNLNIDTSLQNLESMCDIFTDKRSVEAFQLSITCASYTDVAIAAKHVLVHQLTVKKFQCLYLSNLLISSSAHNEQLEFILNKVRSHAFPKLCAYIFV